MKKLIIIAAILFVGNVSALAQVEFDRPEAFLFERKNRLVAISDTIETGKSDRINIGSYKYKEKKSFAVTDPIDYKGYCSVYGNADVNSNAITNSFVKSLLYNYSYIDQNLIQQQINRLKSSNRFGADINAGSYGQYRVKNILVEAGLKYRSFYAEQFSRDDFSLIFKGNNYGQTANLSPLNVTDYTYQALYVGARKTIDKKKRITVGMRVGYIKGGSLQYARSKNMSLYTATDGSYINLNGDFQVAYSNDSTNSSVPRTTGNGMYTDFNFVIKGDKGEFVAELLDLGFIRWNNVSYYSGNGQYQYSGFNYNPLAANSLSITSVTPVGFFDQMGLNRQTKNVTYMLPTTLHLAYFRHLTPKITVSGGVRQMAVPGYIPRVYGKLAYYIRKDFVIIPTLAYGGFGRADIELGISKTFKEHVIVSVNLFCFEYLVAPNKTSGNGLSFSMSYYF